MRERTGGGGARLAAGPGRQYVRLAGIPGMPLCRYPVYGSMGGTEHRVTRDPGARCVSPVETRLSYRCPANRIGVLHCERSPFSRVQCAYCSQEGNLTYDLVIKNGMVIDGTGFARYRADLGIKDGTIATIGQLRGAASAHDWAVCPSGIGPVHSRAGAAEHTLTIAGSQQYHSTRASLQAAGHSGAPEPHTGHNTV